MAVNVVVVVDVCYCFNCLFSSSHLYLLDLHFRGCCCCCVLLFLLVFILLLFCYCLLFSTSQFVFAGFDISVSFLLDELDKVHLPAATVVVFHELALEEVLDGGVAADGELGPRKNVCRLG